jgi:hypothetical protein
MLSVFSFKIKNMQSDILQSDAILSSRLGPQGNDAPRRRATQIGEVEKVVDETAEQVRRDFETFLSK